MANSETGIVNPVPKRRRWLQFGIKSLILVTVAAALAATWWRQWKQQEELNEARQKLRWAEHELEYAEGVKDIFHALDLGDVEHREVARHLQQLGGTSFLDYATRRQFNLEGIHYEIILLHSDAHGIPGIDESLAVVIGNNRVVGFVHHESSTRSEFHTPELKVTGDDGLPELVIHCSPGPWSRLREDHDIVYTPTSHGFVKQK